MKTILMTVSAVLALVGSVFGQGQVTMANNAASLVTLNDLPVAVGSTFFQLTWGNQTGPNGSFTPIGPVVGVNVNAAGRIANYTTPANVLPANVTLFFQILAWQGNYSSYHEAALGNVGLVGYSTQFQATTSANNTSLPTSLAGLYPSFSILTVPEPSTFALLGMGAVTVLAFRRRW